MCLLFFFSKYIFDPISTLNFMVPKNPISQAYTSPYLNDTKKIVDVNFYLLDSHKLYNYASNKHRLHYKNSQSLAVFMDYHKYDFSNIMGVNFIHESSLRNNIPLTMYFIHRYKQSHYAVHNFAAMSNFAAANYLYNKYPNNWHEMMKGLVKNGSISHLDRFIAKTNYKYCILNIICEAVETGKVNILKHVYTKYGLIHDTYVMPKIINAVASSESLETVDYILTKTQDRLDWRDRQSFENLVHIGLAYVFDKRIRQYLVDFFSAFDP